MDLTRWVPTSWPVWVVVAVVAVELAFRVVALAVVPLNRAPSSAMAWLLAITFVPFGGLVAFVVIGSPKLPRRRRERQSRVNEWIEERTAGADAPGPRRELAWLSTVARMNRHLGALPVVAGNAAALYSDSRASIGAMVAEIDAARRFVHAEFYILALDPATEPFFDALAAAVARGVVVRVLFDHLASRGSPGYRQMVARLERAGASWHRMLPVWPTTRERLRPDLRNHRKLLVVDGLVAWTGSQNIVDRGYHKKRYRRRALQWQDLMVRLEGAVVAEVDALFVTDWYSETDELLAGAGEPVPLPHGGEPLECQVVPSGPGFPGENNLKLFNALFYYAQERVVITSPYFVPDDSLLYAITTAAERGLQVELFASEVADQWLVFHAQRSYYEALLRSGVRIFLYPAPYVLHAKHVTIDDEVAVVGSSNMDMRSFNLNLEVSVLVHGASFVRDLRAVEAGYRRRSRELTLDEWLDRPWRDEFVDNLARLTSALQ